MFFCIFFGKCAVRALNRLHFDIAEGKTIFVFAVAVLAYAVPVLLGGNGYLSVYLCGIIMDNSCIKIIVLEVLELKKNPVRVRSKQEVYSNYMLWYTELSLLPLITLYLGEYGLSRA